MDIVADYSIDMIRLKVVVDPSSVELNLNNLFCNEGGVKFYIGTGISKYRYNWSVQEVDPYGNIFSYWIGYWHNTDTNTGKHSLVIEYNPNKCLVIGKLGIVLRNYYSNFSIVELVSFDIACDLPYSINNFCYDKKNKHDCRKFKSTYYFGRGDCAVKVYDKKEESSLSYDLTRYEVSMKIKQNIKEVLRIDLFEIKTLPEMFVIGTNENIKDMDKAVIYGLQHDPTLLGGFTRTMKNKYKKILEQFGRFVPDGNSIASTIKEYLLKLNSVINI